MATRDRDLRPDVQRRYRPYLGWKKGADGVRRQHRFNLGTDRKKAERRLAKLRELYEDNCKAGGIDCWSPLGLRFAEKIAQGEFRIQYPVGNEDYGEDPLVADAQWLHRERGRFPSVDIVPEHPDIYEKSRQISKWIV